MNEGAMTSDQGDQIISILQQMQADSLARHQEMIAHIKMIEEIQLYLVGGLFVLLGGLILLGFFVGWRAFK
ncbi:hypothetical protein [Brevibacillus reuszeri]|uniref:hypothetical protein n=1 Tax=Brevibacillus reuszeri TaxID=54915 RepID=UPI000CCC7DE5|nr:hypothetical protein [Brevibacillus reuszeri]